MWRGLRCAGLMVLALGCAGSADDQAFRKGPDPALLEAIDWYLGTGGQVDDVRAKAALETAVASGDALSVMWLARVHSTGRMGFPRDEARARQLAIGVIDEVGSRAEHGVLEAVFLMGTAFAEGLGKQLDPKEAVRWYRLAAEGGHVLAQHNLGNAYAEGRGLPKDESQAVLWWERAAQAGDAIPALRLGEAYERGVGVPVDLERAGEWYEQAAARGNQAAADALERLAQSGA